MKKKILSLSAALLLCILMIIPVTAYSDTGSIPGFVGVERTLPLVVDYADILTDDEEQQLIESLEAFCSEHKMEIGLVTVDSYEGRMPMAYADDFYDYNGFGYGENDDGLVVVFNTGEGDGNRNIAISTHGTALNAISDAEIDTIIDTMIPYFIDGYYSDGFYACIGECESAIDNSLPFYFVIIAIIIGFVIAFIIMSAQASKLKTVKAKVDAAAYVNGVSLTSEHDAFTYRDVKRTPIPKSSGSGSSHRSSSGRSHGGGSRSF